MAAFRPLWRGFIAKLRLFLLSAVLIGLLLPCANAMQAGFVGRMGPLSNSQRATLNLQLVGASSLPSFVSFTRASGRTCIDGSGVMRVIGNDVPCFDYNPATLAPRGLLIEGARTNILLNSNILSTQTVTTAAVSYTLSFYGTGSVTLSGTFTGSLTGSGAYPARSTLTFTPSAGSLTLTVTGNVQFANLEAGPFASSYIPTTSIAATRAADIAVITNVAAIGYNQNDGGIVLSATLAGTDTAMNQRFVHIDDGTNNNRMTITKGSGPANLVESVVVGGAASSIGSFMAPTVGQELRIGLTYDAVGIAGSVNGSSVLSGGTSSPKGITALRIGSSIAGEYLFGWVAYLQYYSYRLPNSTLQQLTQ
ncbi:hypothetical protein V5G24_23040 [Xanthobacter sp. VTT E-85241]|uniref:hypothetical protein n=1 Tax=Roseixanthobacter finlandensis TaxID=3119922 RepID=UPI003729E2E5